MASNNVFDFLVKLLANPSAAQSFLANANDPIRSVDVDDIIEAVGQVSALWGTSGLSPITVPAFLPGATASSILDTFVTSYYATNPVDNNVWADGRVTQAFGSEGGVAVSAGKKIDDVTAATDGSIAVGGKVHDGGLAVGGIAAGDDARFWRSEGIVVGDNNVNIDGGSGNTVVQGNVTDVSGNGNNVAGDNSIVQEAENGGQNALGNAIDESNIAGKNQAQAGGDAYANDGNVAVGAESVATNGNVANVNNDGPSTESALGASPQAAGEDSNQVSDSDVVNINQDLTYGANTSGTGWDADGSGSASNQSSTFGAITIAGDDVLAAGYGDSKAVGDNSVLVTSLVSNVSQDNDTFTNTQGGTAGDGGAAGIGAASGGSVSNSGPQANSVDSNAATGINNHSADDEASVADHSSAVSGHVGSGGSGGDATGTGSAGSGSSGGSANSSLAASGGSEQANAGSVAVDHSYVAVSYGGDAALGTNHSDIAQGSSVVSDDGDVYDDNGSVDLTDSYNDDFVHTEGNKSPGFLADDHSDIDDVDVDIDD